MKTYIALFVFFFSLVYINLSAQDAREDVIYMKNGSVYRGTIIEQIPNVSFKIEIAGESVIFVKAEDIEKITKEERPGSYGNSDRYRGYVKPRKEFHYRDNGYFFQGEVMAGFFEGGIRIINGYKFNQFGYLGIGIGIEGVGSDVYVNRNTNYSGAYIPLFVYYAGDILKKKITPFYHVNAGYTFWPAVSDPLGLIGGSAANQKGGFMAGAGFGCKFYKSSHVNITLSANIDLKNPSADVNNYYYNNGMSYNVTTRSSPVLVMPVFMFGIGF